MLGNRGRFIPPVRLVIPVSTGDQLVATHYPTNRPIPRSEFRDTFYYYVFHIPSDLDNEWRNFVNNEGYVIRAWSDVRRRSNNELIREIGTPFYRGTMHSLGNGYYAIVVHRDRYRLFYEDWGDFMSPRLYRIAFLTLRGTPGNVSRHWS